MRKDWIEKAESWTKELSEMAGIAGGTMTENDY